MIGSTEPRIYTPPLREPTPDTSLGFACIDYVKDVLHESPYPWQEWWLIHALEIVGDLEDAWHFRFRNILTLVSRQNGKTELSKWLVSFFLNVLQVRRIYGTSLSLEKAEEVWEEVCAIQQEIPELEGEIERVDRKNGAKKLKLSGGRTYKTGAPSRRSGRGDPNDLVMLDEVRELRDWEVWSAAAPSINARPNGMVVCISNAGDPDSVVLRHLRNQALNEMGEGNDADFGGDDVEALALFEWSAEDGADMDDIEAIAQANPAMGHGFLTERAILSSAKTYPEAKFRAECMCQMVETILEPPFPEGSWRAGTDPSSTIEETADLFYGIDLSRDREMLSIAVCGLREDGNAHIEVIARRAGTDWVHEYMKRLASRGLVRLAFQGRGAPVTDLGEQLCAMDGMERFSIEGSELTGGFGRFYDAVASLCPANPRGGMHVYHIEQPLLDECAATAQLKNMGAGTMVIDRVKSPHDVAPLQACVCAFTAMTMKRKEKVYESSYANDAPLVFI